MQKKKSEGRREAISIAEEAVEKKIIFIRGQQVMLDRDLARLYEVDTKYLKRQVRRHIERFPQDFMFQLTDSEFEDWRCIFGTSNPSDKMGLRYSPYAFTEHGILMLSSVLNSRRAVDVNIAIMRIFVRVKKMIITQKELIERVRHLEIKDEIREGDIKTLYDLINQLVSMPEEKVKPKIGFHP